MCNECDKRATCTKPCEAVEVILREDGIRSQNWYGKRRGKLKRYKGHVEIAFSNIDGDMLSQLKRNNVIGEDESL